MERAGDPNDGEPVRTNHVKGLIFKVVATAMLWMLCHVAHAGTVTYVYTDPQGTPLAEADASGTIIATYDYAPYGMAVASMSPAPNGPGYTGHVNDPDTGLVYMQARYYDPAVGRFLSVDPVGPSPSSLFHFNRYNYASNNPIVNMDPDGRDDTCMGNMQCEGGGVGSSGGGSASPTGLSGQTANPTTSGTSSTQTVNQIDIGKDAHSTIQAIALASSPSFFAETAYDPNGIYFGGRPDIGNVDLRSLWEIKPIAGRDSGDAQLLGYLIMSGFRYKPGGLPSFFHGNPVLTAQGMFATYEYHYALNAVIYYDYKLKPNYRYQYNFFPRLSKGEVGMSAAVSIMQSIIESAPVPVPVP